MELHDILENTAYAIAERGTQTESLTLEALAAAIRATDAGVAEALVDWDGSEIARLRAFGIAYGILRRQPAQVQEGILTTLDRKLRVALAA